MHLSLKRLGKLIQRFFRGPKVTQAAYQSELIRRSGGKLTGEIFLQAFVFACLERRKTSLTHVAQVCHDLGVEISPQGLDERISQRSVAFMKLMFQAALGMFSNQVSLGIALIEQFSALNLVDSSIIPLPAGMVEAYPGSGGNASAASLKVRLVFEYRYGNLKQLLFRPGKEADQGFGGYLSVVSKGSLNLMDLGHFNLSHFRQIMDRQAYFLSRYHHQVVILSEAEERLDLLAVLQQACRSVLDRPVKVGANPKHRLPCRLIVFRLKQEVADQRRRKAKVNAKRRGQTVSQRTLALMDWSLYLTNVPQTMLTPDQVALLYRVRWQIELVFKLWKSYAGLRAFSGLRQERVLTELYARLIGLILTHFLVAPLRLLDPAQPQREISPVQVRLIFQRLARSLALVLDDLTALVAALDHMLVQIKRFGLKQRRRKKPNICLALALASTLFSLEFTPQQQIEVLALGS